MNKGGVVEEVISEMIKSDKTFSFTFFTFLLIHLISHPPPSSSSFPQRERERATSLQMMDRVRSKLQNLSTADAALPPPVRFELMDEAPDDLGARKALQDEKYFERRRRNNLAAKKSRDLRKVREDQMALRVAVLEGENAVLVSQVAMLREEAGVLGLYFLARRTSTSTTNSSSSS